MSARASDSILDAHPISGDLRLRRASLELLQMARDVLEANHPQTVRQVYYQLVSRQAIENIRAQYQRVSRLLVEGRQSGLIPWEWVEDRLRHPRSVSMWDGLADFADTVQRAYRRDVWASQPVYLEVWVEKDALSGIFEDVLRPYGVTLNVGRGYDGWDSIKNAAARLMDAEGSVVLYFGDFDPSGDDMVRSLRERLAFFGCRPELVKCALNHADIETYNLPPDATKKTDTRAAKFVQKYGDLAVELDALPVDVLRERIDTEVRNRMDLFQLAITHAEEDRERERLAGILGMIDGDINGR